MTDYLKLEDGETKEFTVKSFVPYVQLRHYVGDKPYPCTTPNCDFCKQGVPVRRREILTVNDNGHDWLWAMSDPVARTLRAMAPDPDNLHRLRIQLTRYGTGTATKYDIQIIKPQMQMPEIPDWDSYMESKGGQDDIKNITHLLYGAARWITVAADKLKEVSQR